MSLRNTPKTVTCNLVTVMQVSVVILASSLRFYNKQIKYNQKLI